MSFQDPSPPTFVTAARDSYPDTARTFASLTEFVSALPPRIASREHDFGLTWRDRSAAYRAAWIEDTGELYVVQLGEPEDGGGHVELLAAGASLERTRRALLGWRTRCGREDSLTWLRSASGQLDAHDAVVPAPG
jgi:hypothetical protein